MPSDQHSQSAQGAQGSPLIENELPDGNGEHVQLTLRDRIIPFTALSVLVILIGIFAYTLYTPTSSSLGAGGRVNSIGSTVYLGDRQAPDFTLYTFDGERVTLSDYRGKSVVMNFWSSWCPPCRDEAPMLNEFHAETQDGDEVVLLGVAIWDREEDALAFMAQHDLTFTNLSDQRGSVLIDYGVYGVPETYFIGPDGTLQGKYRGPLESADHIKQLQAEFARDGS